MGIRNHCGGGDIVFDVDADDSLIGSQVFNLINRLYQKTKKWFIYSNYITIKKKNLTNGLSDKIRTP